MKKLLTIIAFFFLTAAPAIAATVNITFEWDANTETDLAGYRLYQSSSPGVYVRFVQNPSTPNLADEVGLVTTTSIDVEMAMGEKRYFTLSAFDTAGNESLLSNEVTFFLNDTSQGVPPKTPSLTIKSYQVISY